MKVSVETDRSRKFRRAGWYEYLYLYLPPSDTQHFKFKLAHSAKETTILKQKPNKGPHEGRQGGGGVEQAEEDLVQGDEEEEEEDEAGQPEGGGG